MFGISFLLGSMFILFRESRKRFLEVIADENFVEPKRTSVVFNSILFIGIAKLRIDRNVATLHIQQRILWRIFSMRLVCSQQ